MSLHHNNVVASEGAHALPETAGRKTFVLVHGAWHGGWCWRKVADLLRGEGHRVYTPTLTGLADRSHLLSTQVRLDTHIDDIVNLFRWEELSDVHLVLHSYGGWPGAGALEHVGERVASVMYLDAFLPRSGERAADYASPFNRAALQEAVARGELGRAPPHPSVFKVNKADQAWVASLMTPQPNGVIFDEIRLTGALERVARKTYVRAPSFEQPALDRMYERCRLDPTWSTRVTEAGHDVMIDDPQWLARELLAIADAEEPVSRHA